MAKPFYGVEGNPSAEVDVLRFVEQDGDRNGGKED
jgi:hypothetical protein